MDLLPNIRRPPHGPHIQTPRLAPVVCTRGRVAIGATESGLRTGNKSALALSRQQRGGNQGEELGELIHWQQVQVNEDGALATTRKEVAIRCREAARLPHGMQRGSEVPARDARGGSDKGRRDTGGRAHGGRDKGEAREGETRTRVRPRPQ